MPEITEKLVGDLQQGPSDGPKQKIPVEENSPFGALIGLPVINGFRKKMRDLGGGLKGAMNGWNAFRMLRLVSTNY